MKAQKYTKETIKNIGLEADSSFAPLKFDKFEVGSLIKVSLRIKEGDKERIQIFEGDVIAIKHNGISSSFTVRKIGANSVAVERIFPFSCPTIQNISFVRKGEVRRAKLYYIRERIGKAARVKELILTKEQKEKKKLLQ